MEKYYEQLSDKQITYSPFSIWILHKEPWNMAEMEQILKGVREGIMYDTRQINHLQSYLSLKCC